MENKDLEKKVETIDVEATSEQAPKVESNSGDKAKDYFKRGMEDAAKRAEQYAPKFKKEVESVISEVAYGAGFVPGFLGAFVNEFLPENLKESMQEGASKGEAQAKTVAGKVREAKAKTKSDDSDKYAPSAEA